MRSCLGIAMIIGKYKAIHVHIPKCAGMSIEAAFGAKKLGQHYHKRRFIRTFGAHKWEKYFKFAFVRNPWDRFVSLYHFRKKYQKSHIKGRSFKQCMMRLFDEYPQRVHQMHYWVMLGDDPIVDFIGRFENLNEDFEKVCKMIGAEGITLPHVNKTDHVHYSHYYDDECLEFVAANCKRDIELFGYKFEDLRGSPI